MPTGFSGNPRTKHPFAVRDDHIPFLHFKIITKIKMHKRYSLTLRNHQNWGDHIIGFFQQRPGWELGISVQRAKRIWEAEDLDIWKAGYWVAHPCGTCSMKHYSHEAYRFWLALELEWQFFLSCRLNPSVRVGLGKSGWQKEKGNDTYFIRTCTKGCMDLFSYLVIFWSTIWNIFCLLTSIHILEKLMLLKVIGNEIQ